MKESLFSIMALIASVAVVSAEPTSVLPVPSSNASQIFGGCGGIAANSNWCTPDLTTTPINSPCGVSVQPSDYVVGTGFTSAGALCSTVATCTGATAVVGCGGT